MSETKPELTTVGRSERRVDSVKLATGRGTFVDDIALPALLHARILHSPHAHARIRRIDASRARAMPGVVLVLTHEDVPRVPYTTAGQGWPEPSPYDAVMLDNKVRFVGDRVAVVAAEDPQLAAKACNAIDVEYEPLPAVFDPERSMAAGAPVIHDQPDATGIRDPARNLAAEIQAEVGDVEAALAGAERTFEGTYRVGYVQQSSIEPHITITWLDEDDRLMVRTSTQVPFHVRRIIAPLLGIPIRRIRVIKPRIGGGFGGKQEILIEDLCGMITLRTGRPCRLEYTREEELTAARTRHPQIVKIRSGVSAGKLVALELDVLENTGAYGTHALTVMSVTGNRALSLYRCPNLRYVARAVYTNLAVAGAFRGYGCPQGFFALESHIDEVCAALGEDPVEFRSRNHVREGDDQPIAQVLGEGREGFQQIVRSCGLPEAIRLGARAIDWSAKREPSSDGPLRRGVGVAIVMQASGIPGVDMGAASMKMNEDASFNLLMGATDGRHVTYEQVCLSSLYQRDQFQIMATASHMSYDSPPPFAAVFVEVDVETGLVRVLKLVEAVDCGQVVNPSMAEGQVEGAAVQSLGYAVFERMPFDAEGRMQFRSFREYTLATATDVPEIVTILVPTHEPTGPFGAKAVAEIPINGPAPAIANAVFHATGARIRELPLTPDRVLRALREKPWS